MNLEELKKLFVREKLLRDTAVSFIFVCAGLLLLAVMFIIASFMQRGGDLYYLLQNLGLFFIFAGMVLACTAVHRGNIHQGGTIRSLTTETAKQAHLVIGILIASICAVLILALVELVPSLFGYIPYAGPVIVALLSVPLFVINCAVIAAVVMIWILVPLMIGEDIPVKQLPKDYITIVRKRGIVIFSYTILALLVMATVFGGVLMIIRYATGITKAVQWNIAPAYPQMFKALTRTSYITDIIVKIAPRTDPVSVLQQYGASIFNYLDMLGTLLGVLYGIIFAAIASFFLAVYFNVLSFLYVIVGKDARK